MPLTSLQEEKQRLRSEMRKKRRDLSTEQVSAWSKLIADHFCSWPIYRSCKAVMFYLATSDEVQTDLIISDALRRRKTVGVPLLGKKYGEMTVAEITSLDDLVVGKYGLKMPAPEKSKCISPALLNLVVVPAVAFDRSGNRLGLGAGYYDRFLLEAGNSVLIGLAWECQLTDQIPNEPHDVRMQYLLTENGLIVCE
jgi:5-formyltetrahydrofolate cyclo-ligase